MNKATLVIAALADRLVYAHYCVDKELDGLYFPYWTLCAVKNTHATLTTLAQERGKPYSTRNGCYRPEAFHHKINIDGMIPLVNHSRVDNISSYAETPWEGLPRYTTVEKLVETEGREPWWWDEPNGSGGTTTYRDDFLAGKWPRTW